ncbi:hypothetical protein AB3N61_18230 [Leptospira sp. WS58.C1]|uniref:hypothetical protein n=1 Tax=Leptospira cinconiae TaxID=3235173 RepID=UPI00349EE684
MKNIVGLFIIFLFGCQTYYERDNVALKVKNIQTNNLPVIVNVSSNPPNSAGGVDFGVIWKNVSFKTIKYISFSAVPYNSVGDTQSCSIRKYSLFNGQHPGPFPPGYTSPEGHGWTSHWRDAWYNSSITCVKLQKVEVIFMDNSKVTISDIAKITDPNQEVCPPVY